MGFTVKTTANFKGLNALRKQLRKKVEVGYIDSPVHWANTERGLTVGELARYLHYDSPWGELSVEGSFMLDVSQRDHVQKIVNTALQQGLGNQSVQSILQHIGQDGQKMIRYLVESRSSPPNSQEWAHEKGYNDPLQHGSHDGETPNLISEVTYRVTKL